MSRLLLMKALNLICAAEDKHYVKGKKKFVKQMTHGSKSHRALGSIGAGTDAIPTTSPEPFAARQRSAPLRLSRATFLRHPSSSSRHRRIVGCLRIQHRVERERAPSSSTAASK
ncbi:hypothetical protein ACFX13_028397 [Malus domestica]